MWFLFHHNTKTKAVSGGESFTQRCPSCERQARFVEVEITEDAGVWFVDVIGDKARAFACTACGDTFDVKGESNDAADVEELPPRKTAAELAADAKRVEQRRLAEQARRELAAEHKAVRIEDELAALKKKMGR